MQYTWYMMLNEPPPGVELGHTCLLLSRTTPRKTSHIHNWTELGLVLHWTQILGHYIQFDHLTLSDIQSSKLMLRSWICRWPLSCLVCYNVIFKVTCQVNVNRALGTTFLLLDSFLVQESIWSPSRHPSRVTIIWCLPACMCNDFGPPGGNDVMWSTVTTAVGFSDL